MSRLQETLHDFVSNAGFTLLDRVQIYRATVQTEVGDRVKQNVFLDLNDDEPSMMSVFGKSSDISTMELDVVRLADDGYELTFTSESVGFLFKFQPDVIRADPDQILTKAHEIAAYAAAIEFVIHQNRNERDELIGLLRPIVDSNWEAVTSGQVPVQIFLEAAERLFAIHPNRDMWGHVVVTARNAAIEAWASGSVNLPDQSWSKIADRLEVVGSERGWEVTDDDWA